VREALIALEVEGLVEVRIGSGIYVRPPAPAPVGKARANGHGANGHAAEWGPLELMKARELVEGEVAALAARHARKAADPAMADALEQMREAAAAGIVPREGDGAFHSAIAGACGNGVLHDTVVSYWDARSGVLFERMSDYFENPGVLERRDRRTRAGARRHPPARRGRGPRGDAAPPEEGLHPIQRELAPRQQFLTPDDFSHD
jgi:DNA-binding FadR family transcriptional regulator